MIKVINPDLTVDLTFSLMSESSIDFPMPDLDASMWEKDGDDYVMTRDVKLLIHNYIEKSMKVFNDFSVEEIHVIGSMCTNLYEPSSDIDVHLVPVAITSKTAKEWEKMSQDLKKWSWENPEFIGSHPMELFIQVNQKQDAMSDGCYNLVEDTWVSGPKIYDGSYNPYDIFKGVFAKVETMAKKSDIDIGSLKRDVIDYDIIKAAIKNLPEENKKELKEDLFKKLKEIEADIMILIKDRKDVVGIRKSLMNGANKDQAIGDVEYVKRWKDLNAIFKFMNRYEYIKLISDIEDAIDDKSVEDSEVNVIKNVLKSGR